MQQHFLQVDLKFVQQLQKILETKLNVDLSEVDLKFVQQLQKILETKLNVDLSEVLLGIHKLSIYPLAVSVDFSVILQNVQQHFSQVDLKFCILVELRS